MCVGGCPHPGSACHSRVGKCTSRGFFLRLNAADSRLTNWGVFAFVEITETKICLLIMLLTLRKLLLWHSGWRWSHWKWLQKILPIPMHSYLAQRLVCFDNTSWSAISLSLSIGQSDNPPHLFLSCLGCGLLFLSTLWPCAKWWTMVAIAMCNWPHAIWRFYRSRIICSTQPTTVPWHSLAVCVCALHVLLMCAFAVFVQIFYVTAKGLRWNPWKQTNYFGNPIQNTTSYLAPK